MEDLRAFFAASAAAIALALATSYVEARVRGASALSVGDDGTESLGLRSEITSMVARF